MMRFTQNRYCIMMQMIYHLNALDPFKFGSKWFSHWKWDEFQRRSFYVKSPKYSNLKEECLNNSIHQISLKMFQNLLVKAMIHQRSNEGKRKTAADREANSLIFET